MKALALILALLAPLPFSRGARVAGEDPDPSFRRDLEKLAAQSDKIGMGKLVKGRPEAAVAWIVATCEEIADRPSADLEAFAAILREAWQAGMGSAFAEREYEALKNLGANRRDRNDLKERLDAAEKEFTGNLERKDATAFQNVVDELDVVAPGLEQVGDWYRASQAWIVQAKAFDEPLRDRAADLHKAWMAYQRAVEARAKVDLKDAVQAEIAKRAAELLAKGHDKKKEAAPEPEPPAGGDAGTPPAGGAAAPGSGEAAPALTVASTFEPVPDLDAYARPNYLADEIHILWLGLGIKAKGTSATFQRVQDGPAVIRTGSSDIRVDVNGDGQGDEKLALAGNPLLVTVTIGKGDQARPWAFLAQVGGEKDQYQKVEINCQPSDQNYTVYTAPAASIVGNLGGVPIRVIDEDMDGAYGNRPQTWGETGLTKDNFQPEMDSIVIGANKRARPWSELQQVGDGWYRLEPDRAGKRIKATPVAVETGILKLDYKGPPPSWVVVQGVGETAKSHFFDLVEGGTKGVVVPVGIYRLYYGEMRKGKKKQVEKTLILPSKTTPSVEVKKGKTATMTLGAPYGFDFRVSSSGDKLKVEGMSVVVVGSQGERYERPWNCVPRPEVSWRRKGSKSAGKPEKMPQFQDPAGFSVGFDVAWFPLDLELPLKGEKNPVEVQLTEKKHSLFGKIESDWKE